jgi:hypothetical protein
MHVVYQLSFQNKHYLKVQGSSCSTVTTKSARCRQICTPIKSGVFLDLFPFYVLFNRKLEIISMGDSLKEGIKSAIGECVKDVFNLIRPYIPFTWDDVSLSDKYKGCLLRRCLLNPYKWPFLVFFPVNKLNKMNFKFYKYKIVQKLF